MPALRQSARVRLLRAADEFGSTARDIALLYDGMLSAMAIRVDSDRWLGLIDWPARCLVDGQRRAS